MRRRWVLDYMLRHFRYLKDEVNVFGSIRVSQDFGPCLAASLRHIFEPAKCLSAGANRLDTAVAWTWLEYSFRVCTDQSAAQYNGGAPNSILTFLNLTKLM